MTERDFSDFDFADIAIDNYNVYDLADEIIFEIAEHLEVEVGIEPTTEEIDELIKKIGRNQIQHEGRPIMAIDREMAFDLAESSGIQKELDRSLWTPEVTATGNIDTAVVTSALADWQDRMTQVVQNKVLPETPVVVAAGTQVLDSPTDKANPRVAEFFEAYGSYPTEAEYARNFVMPNLRLTHETVHDMTGYDVANGEIIAKLIFEDRPDLLDQRLGFVRVAGAGIQFIAQMRTAARETDPHFDDTEESPQAFVLTDSFPLAKTKGQENQPASYQKPIPALKRMLRTARILHKTAAAEEFADLRT